MRRTSIKRIEIFAAAAMALVVVATLLTEAAELVDYHIGGLVTLRTAAIRSEQAHQTSAIPYLVVPPDVGAGSKSAESRR
jgi:hypothetical protein